MPGSQSLSAAEATAIGRKAKEVLAEILNLMGVEAAVELKVGEKADETVLEIRAENSGLLIGRKGQTLEALQYLVSRIAGERGAMEGPHVVVDIGDQAGTARRVTITLRGRAGS